MSDDVAQAEITNIVATVDLHCKIKSDDALSRMPSEVHVKYIPEQFLGAIVKLKQPRISILMFTSGKLVVTGVRSIKMIHKAVKVISKFLREVAHSMTRKANITVQNFVATGTRGKHINLELAALLLEHSMYEPEQFPSLIYRMQDPKVVLLLF